MCAVGANEIAAFYGVRAPGATYEDLDAIVELLKTQDWNREFYLRMSEITQVLEGKMDKLMLLVLYRVRIWRVVFEQSKVELRHNLIGCAVPNSKQRFNHSILYHLVNQAKPGQHLERRRMEGCGARCRINSVAGFEEMHRNALLGQCQRRNDPAGPPRR